MLLLTGSKGVYIMPQIHRSQLSRWYAKRDRKNLSVADKRLMDRTVIVMYICMGIIIGVVIYAICSIYAITW